jgi:hypothetical protein
VFKLRLQTRFPERPQNQNTLLSLSTHPDRNAFLVSDGSSAVLVEFPEGFDDHSAYAELLTMKSEQLLKKFKKKSFSKVTSSVPPNFVATLEKNSKQVSVIRKVLKGLMRNNHESLSVQNHFEVGFDEILAPAQLQLQVPML